VVLPGYAVPAEALDDAIWRAAISEPPTPGADALDVLTLQSIVEQPGTRALGPLVHVDRLVLTDFVVVEGPLQTVRNGVVSGDDMWVAVGATVELLDVDLIQLPILYQPTLNPDFSPQLLAFNQGTQFDFVQGLPNYSGNPINPMEPLFDCQCGGNIGCIGSTLDTTVLYGLASEFVSWPDAFSVDPGLFASGVPSSLFEQELFIAGGWPSSPLTVPLSDGFGDQGGPGVIGGVPDCGPGGPGGAPGSGGACEAGCIDCNIDPPPEDPGDPGDPAFEPPKGDAECGVIAQGAVVSGLCGPQLCDVTPGGAQLGFPSLDRDIANRGKGWFQN